MADIFSDVMGFVGKTLNQAFTGDTLKDYKHASKLFVADQYKLMPKLGFLFHVFIDINPQAFPFANDMTGNPNYKDEIGMLVKSVSLPKFNLDVKKYNAYNRPNFVQSKINYESVNITFHDDSANLIRNFWFDYYNYYYRDSDYTPESFQIPHKYQPSRAITKYGYSPRNVPSVQYINAIRIFSLHQKRFSEYVLINPIIKSFKHGEHVQGSNDTMTHEMTVDYESVIYRYGRVSAENVKGFVNLHYDKSPSPLTPAGGGTRSVFGPGGLLETAGDVADDVANGNYGAAIFKAGMGIQNMRHMDIGKAAIGEILTAGTGMMRNTNPNNPISVPNLGSGGGIGGMSLGGLFGGIGSSGGSSSWLAGAAGLGLASVFAGTRSQEVTAASADASGFPPATPYEELPSPTEEVVLASIQQDQIYAGEAMINDQNSLVTATDQGSVDPVGQGQDLDNNLRVVESNLADAQVEYGTAKQAVEDAENTHQLFTNRYDTFIAGGGDPDGNRAKYLKGMIDQSSEMLSSANDKLTAAEQNLNETKDLKVALNEQKSNLV